MKESRIARALAIEESRVHVRPRDVARLSDQAAKGAEKPLAQPLKDMMMTFAQIEDVIAAIGRGEMVVVVDDQNRENEGDVIFAAEHATPEKVAFMMNKARGLICAPMQGARLEELAIPLMVPVNTESHQTAFTVSVDYVHGTSTGISAADRAITLRALVSKSSRPADFARPGHIFPLRANPKGVLGRPGHTEAAVDLCRLAGLAPAGVICEIANDDGTMARLPELEVFAKEHGLLLATIEDLIAWRERTEQAYVEPLRESA